ncbi:MAG TPA: sugar ABC transporter permease [Bacillales bacterium]|nr:sugar ABC transporter permease [Bacillales bacterium]
MKKPKGSFTSTLFVVPYLVMFLCFLFIPIVYGIYISFHDWGLLDQEHPWVGLKNYLALFDSDTLVHSEFFTGFWNTFQFVVYSVPPLVVIGLALALLVNSLPKRLKTFFRTAYFIPYAISVSVIAVVWLWLLDTNAGLVNNYLTALGFQPVPWLTTLPYAWISIVVATIWWTIGFNMIIFVNALNDVPDELYEAASIDGASAWQKLTNITLPSIKSITLFVVITSTIASFNVFGQPYLMTRGGPGDSTRVLLMEIVEEAFSRRELGSASAMAITMALVMILISIFQFKVSNIGKGGKSE